MDTPGKPAAKMVGQDTMFFTAFACLVVGFVAGIVFSVYKLSPPSDTPSQPAQVQGQQLTEEQGRVIENLKQTVAKEPDNLQAWTQLGHLYFDTSRFEQAIEAYTRSLELDPDNPDVLTDLGVMYRRSGRPQDAVASFDRAIALDSGHETARFNKGVVLLYDLEDRQGAVKVWQELVEINPVAYAPNGRLVSELLADLQP